MKPDKKIFEPITDAQNRKLHAMIAHEKPSETRLYRMIENLIGIGSISSLSKQEASHIIEWLENDSRAMRPPPPRSEKSLGKEASRMPSYAQIKAIRHICRSLGWDKDHLKNWLKKYVKAPTIRELDRQSATKAIVGLKAIKKYQESDGVGIE